MIQRRPRGDCTRRGAAPHARRVQGETVYVVADDAMRDALPQVLVAAHAATPRTVRWRASEAGVLVTVGGGSCAAPCTAERVVLLAQDGRRPSEALRRAAARLAAPGARMDVVRAAAAPLPPDAAARVGRLVAGTRLGLALGAGGALGLAHVGALEVLEDAGCPVDAIGGSSIGAVVGALHALGRSPREIVATLDELFSPAAVEALFGPSRRATAAARTRMVERLRDEIGHRTIEDLPVPLVAMTVDLASGTPLPLRSGPLWEALVAATALPGLFDPVARDGRRLADAVVLVPVPTRAVAAAGADITVAVDLLGGERLEAWPGEVAGPVAAPQVPGLLAALTEVIDLQQRAASRRDAAAATVTVTPRLAPCDWRDFHLAEHFLTAGRDAARAQLASLRAVTCPTPKKEDPCPMDR